MKDIPIFTTEYGAASLTLREIPYMQTAYIRILTASDPGRLLEECKGFCRAAGAQRIYGAGAGLEGYPVHTSILRMSIASEQLANTDAALFPVQEATLAAWLDIYRGKICHVPNAAWMTDEDGKKMLREGSGYFVHRQGKLLGIGKVGEGSIEFLASTAPGAGEDVLKALSHALFTDTVTLEVASANNKALSLYTRLGFIPTRELTRWHTIWEECV